MKSRKKHLARPLEFAWSDDSFKLVVETTEQLARDVVNLGAVVEAAQLHLEVKQALADVRESAAPRGWAMIEGGGE